MIHTIDSQELRRTMESGEPYALLDVRERGEYALNQIPNAVPIPRGLLEARIGRLVPWRNVPIIVYCDDGERSRRAAETLDALGYEHVSVLDGGIAAWAAAGNETIYGVNVIGKDYGEKVAVQEDIIQLTPGEVLELQRREPRVFILDSRTREEFENAHLPGAFSVPGGELPVTVLSLLEQPENRDATVVVNCAGRTRSILGADILRRAGIDKVYALENGTMAWTMAGLELERGPAAELDVAPTARARARAAEFAARFAAQEDVSGISIDELLDLLQGKWVYVVDVRLPEEYLAGHLLGAISCPGGQLANALDEYIGVRQATLVCVSNEETRARIGAALCKRIGYPDVTYLEGGISAWRARGLPIEVGAPRVNIPGLAEAQAAAKTISPKDLQSRLDDKKPPRLIDVRRSSEYALGHIPGSTWVPRGDLERRIGRAVSPDDAELVVVSNAGERAALAAQTLGSLGYRRVSVLAGGLDAWSAAGNEVVDGLDGADVPLAEAKEDVDLVKRARVLARDREDMIHYLEWEEKLGEKYMRP